MAIKVSGNHTYLSVINSFIGNDEKHKTLLYYEGDINHEITKALTYTIEKNLIKIEEKRIIQKKIFNVMVECLQNIDKHYINNITLYTNEFAKGAILVSSFKDFYSVTSCNIVTYEQVNNLKKIFDNLQNKEKIELRFLYKKQLENGRLSEKGGAGLGFIDIARKTGNPLRFKFFNFNKNLYFFVLDTIINKNL